MGVAYGEGVYGDDVYQATDSASSAQTTSTGQQAAAGGAAVLPNTGTGVLLPILVSLLLITAAIVLFVRRKA